MIAEFNDRDGIEHSRWVEDKVAVLERVDVTLNEQKVGTTFHRQESTTRDVDTVACRFWLSTVRQIIVQKVVPLKCLIAAPAAVSNCELVVSGMSNKLRDKIGT